MRNERVNIILVFLVAVVVLLWYAMPDKGNIQPFPFSDHVIDAQGWIWVGGFYAALAIFASALWVGSSPQATPFFRAAFILQVCLFIEYWLNYNLPWGRVMIFGLSIPVHMATLRLPILLFYAIRTLWKWRT